MMKFAHYSPNEWHQQFLQHIDNFECVFNTCDRECRFVWCGSASMLEKAYPASLKYGIPIIAWVWDLPNIFPEHFARTQMYVHALRKCTAVIAASKFTQHTLAQYGIPSEQMYFYADTEGLGPTSLKKESRIIQVSRYTPHKQFEIAQKVSTELKIPLLNVGFVNTEEVYYWKRLLSEAGDNVEFKVKLPRKQLIEEIQKSTVLVTSSRFEGWGLSPIEALFCHTPIIVSDLPVFREQYGDSVLYHNPQNPETLKVQVQKLFASDELQKQIVHAGRKCVENYTPERFAERWTRMVNRLLSF